MVPKGRQMKVKDMPKFLGTLKDRQIMDMNFCSTRLDLKLIYFNLQARVERNVWIF